MGRQRLNAKSTISKYDEADRKEYFRNHYHNKLNISDIKMVNKVALKQLSIEHLIQVIGIEKILEITQGLLNREVDSISEI